MSDESSAAIIERRMAWLAEHKRMYLESGGTKGHIMDLVDVGAYDFGTHLLLKYTGRKSGKTMITPLCYGDYAGEVVIIGSKGGADTHPAWYLNIIEQDEVQFQIATQAFRATWREPQGAEREKLWNFMADCYPFFHEYKKATDRVIPIIVMKHIEEIPVFRPEDAD